MIISSVLLAATMMPSLWTEPPVGDEPLPEPAEAIAEPQPEAAEPRSPITHVVSDADLSQLRGGFSWQGVDINLGAEIRSYLRDELVMQTNISWSSVGSEVTRYVSGTLSPASADNLRTAIVTGGGITMNGGGTTLYSTDDGQTAFLHRADGAFQNVVINTASGLAVRQELEVSIDLANFAPLQAMTLSDRIGAGLADEIRSSLGAAGFQ